MPDPEVASKATRRRFSAGYKAGVLAEIDRHPERLGAILRRADGSAIATLVERTSRVTMLVKVQGKDTTRLTTTLSRQVRTLPVELRRSLTWDRGHEIQTLAPSVVEPAPRRENAVS